MFRKITTNLFHCTLIVLPFQTAAALSHELKLGLQSYFSEDFTIAYEYLSLSAEANNGEAQYLLGHMFENGEGLEVDHSRSFKWYLAAAKNGVAPAQYSVSLKYSFGIGTPRNIREGLFWLEAAARQGHEYAQFKLGLDLVEIGDTQKGLVWIRIASLANINDALQVYAHLAPAYTQNQHAAILATAKNCVASSFNDCTPLN